MESHVWQVTREQITEYAEASGDRNPIHLDEAFARSVGLPGVVAHGMLTMAHLANCVVAYAGGEPRRVRKLRCRFSGMVLPGDTITFNARVLGEEAGVSRLELTAENQKGERVLSKAYAEVSDLNV